MPAASQSRSAQLKPAARAATLIEMLVIFALFMCMVFGVNWLTDIMGKSCAACLLGPLLGAAVWFAGLFTVAWFLQMCFGGGLPPCRHGSCRAPDDYKLEFVDNDCYDICKHGDRYQRIGRRFVQINEDGSKTPYLIWRRFRGWRPDKD
jgi:hypothetical protein